MNKKILVLALFVSGLSSLVFTGCKDDEDTTPPVVTLNGDPAPVIFLQTNFVDLGATAVDDEDGTLGVTVTGIVDEDNVGVYTLTYEATDAAGNTGSATRVVAVVNELDSDPFEGSYSCTIATIGQPNYNYTESLSTSTTINNFMEWSKFGDYSNANAKMNILIAPSNQIIIPTQTIVCGNPAVARTFSGNGTYTGTGGAGSTIILLITETVNSVSSSFTYTYTKN